MECDQMIQSHTNQASKHLARLPAPYREEEKKKLVTQIGMSDKYQMIQKSKEVSLD